MQNFEGVYLPDSEAHLIEWMQKKGIPRLEDGFPSYQHKKYETAINFVPFRRLAVDIGAHVGQWTRAMVLDFYRVVAFEPVPEYAQCWRKNLEGVGHAELHEVALGAERDIVTLKNYTEGSNGDTRVADEGDKEGGVRAPMWRLDDFNLAGIDFIKIDCEGYELNVLRGAEDTIAREHPVILVEQKRGKASAYGLSDTAAVTWLQERGYSVGASLNGDYLMVAPSRW